MRKPDRRALNLAIIEKSFPAKEVARSSLNQMTPTSGTGWHRRAAAQSISYAIRTIFRVLPALGRSGDHANPPPGLGIKHFVVAGVICARYWWAVSLARSA